MNLPKGIVVNLGRRCRRRVLCGTTGLLEGGGGVMGNDIRK